MGQQPLSERRIYKWSLLVGCSTGYVFAGVCLSNSPIEHQFLMWPWKDTGHGHYVICSSSFAYSHSDAKNNYKKEAFTFKEKDVVDFEFDLAAGLFSAKKRENNAKSYNFIVSPPPTGQHYHPCIYLVSKGDWMEAVDSN